MKTRFIVWTAILLAALMISSCARAGNVAPAAPPEAVVSTSGATSSTAAPESTVPAPNQAAAVPAVATSRGPALEATDPATVNLASGQLQLVEFFRFT